MKMFTKGLTLIELAVISAILVLLVSLALPNIILKEEVLKSDARKITGKLNQSIDEIIFKKKLIKIKIDKGNKEIVFFHCKESFTEMNGYVTKICEWIDKDKTKIKSEMKVFVNGEETFGNEVEIIGDPSKTLPFIEIGLKNKEKEEMWIILNPFTYEVYVDDKPAHEIDLWQQK